MKQDIRFCTTVDGVRIAYATSGQGMLEERQLVRYDPRGTGLSERRVGKVGPNCPPTPPAITQRLP